MLETWSERPAMLGLPACPAQDGKEPTDVTPDAKATRRRICTFQVVEDVKTYECHDHDANMHSQEYKKNMQIIARISKMLKHVPNVGYRQLVQLLDEAVGGEALDCLGGRFTPEGARAHSADVEQVRVEVEAQERGGSSKGDNSSGNESNAAGKFAVDTGKDDSDDSVIPATPSTATPTPRRRPRRNSWCIAVATPAVVPAPSPQMPAVSSPTTTPNVGPTASAPEAHPSLATNPHAAMLQRASPSNPHAWLTFPKLHTLPTPLSERDATGDDLRANLATTRGVETVGDVRSGRPSKEDLDQLQNIPDDAPWRDPLARKSNNCRPGHTTRQPSRDEWTVSIT